MYCNHTFSVISGGGTTQYNLGSSVSFSSVQDVSYCGRVYIIVSVDDDNDIQEFIEDALHMECQSVIIECTSGKSTYAARSNIRTR